MLLYVYFMKFLGLICLLYLFLSVLWVVFFGVRVWSIIFFVGLRLSFVVICLLVEYCWVVRFCCEVWLFLILLVLIFIVKLILVVLMLRSMVIECCLFLRIIGRFVWFVCFFGWNVRICFVGWFMFIMLEFEMLVSILIFYGFLFLLMKVNVDV